MSLVFHRTGIKSRYILSIGVGFVLGFLLSLASLQRITTCNNCFATFSADSSNETNQVIDNPIPSLNDRNKKHRSRGDSTLVDYASRDYEPRIHPLPSQSEVKSVKSGVTVTRPRYVADELGIREKVFIGVLTEGKNLNSFAIFLNQTLADHANKVVFFVGETSERAPSGIEVLVVNDHQPKLKLLHIFQYLAQEKTKQYDWFFLIPDNTFVRGYKFNEFLHHISINQDLYMGQAFGDVHQVYCFLGSGILLSGTVIDKINGSREWCANNSFSSDITDNIGRCIIKASKLSCTNTTNNVIFRSYVDFHFEFDRDIKKLSKRKYFNESLTVHPVNDLETMLKLHKYFNHVEIDEIDAMIMNHRKKIEQLSCYSTEGCGNHLWPIGVPAPFKPLSRFDVLRWEYFNETHIFFAAENQVATPMNMIDYQDVHEIIEFSVQEFSKKYSKKLKFNKLIDGYRQFDPTRGTQYYLDLSMLDSDQHELIKRAELMRPLGLVEIIPMPFVSDQVKLFLIVIVHDDEQEALNYFLERSSQSIFEHERREKLEVLLTHIVNNKEDFSKSQQWFDSARQKIEQISINQTNCLITYHTILMTNNSIRSFDETTMVLDFFQRRLRPNALIFVTNPFVDVETDFLSRCRLNVIEHTQIFFPIAFYQYHPKIIALHMNVTNPNNIELHKSHGWFNAFAFNQIGVYISDYVHLKNILIQAGVSLSSANLFDLFSRWTDFHIIRAPDQSLRVRYQPVQCEHLERIDNNIEQQRCLIQRERGLASQTLLAKTLIEQEILQKPSQNI